MAEPLLKPVDEVEVLTVMDNSLDSLMASTPLAHRAERPRDAFARPPLRAEHGVSMLVTVHSQGRADSLLFDTGVSVDGALHNLDVLEVRPNELHAIVLSHGHPDHTRGLNGLVNRYGRPRLPVVVHPDAFRKRKTILPDAHEVDLPPPSRNDLIAEGVDVLEERGQSLLIDGQVLITGQIDRKTAFENGLPQSYAEIDGQWQPDPWIHDDQAIIIHLRGRGLVVLTGCGHAGVINTLLHARATTGVTAVHAVIGGLHLTGTSFEPIIEPTIEALKEIGPRVIVPQHCTGWRATMRIAQELPDAFVPSSVGTRWVLSSRDGTSSDAY